MKESNDPRINARADRYALEHGPKGSPQYEHAFSQYVGIAENENRERERNNTCLVCGHELVWQSDFSYDEVHGDGEGIVSYWLCPHCGAMHEVSTRTDEEE